MKEYHVVLQMSEEDAASLSSENDSDDDPIIIRCELVAISESAQVLDVNRDVYPNVVEPITTDKLHVGSKVIAAFYPEGCRLLYVPSNNFFVGKLEEN